MRGVYSQPRVVQLVGIGGLLRMASGIANSIKCSLVAAIFYLTAASPVFARNVHVQVGVIKGNGDVKPASRMNIFVYPSDPEKYPEFIMSRYSIGAPPDQSKYRRVVQDNWGKVESTYPIYIRHYKEWKTKFIDAVEKDRSQPRRRPLSFKTDLNGLASINIPDGRWYFCGKYSDSFSEIYWIDGENIDESSHSVELSNDNSIHIYNKSDFDEPIDRKETNQETETRLNKRVSAILLQSRYLHLITDGYYLEGGDVWPNKTEPGIYSMLITAAIIVIPAALGVWAASSMMGGNHSSY